MTGFHLGGKKPCSRGPRKLTLTLPLGGQSTLAAAPARFGSRSFTIMETIPRVLFQARRDWRL